MDTERKEQLAKEENEALLTQYTSCKLNAEALETELKSAQIELDRIRREHEERGKLVAHQQAEIGASIRMVQKSITERTDGSSTI
jgi:hypothetical protein